MDDEAVEHKQLLAVVIPKNHVQATYYLLWNVARNCKNTKIQKYCNFASHFCKGEDGSVVVFAGCRAGKVKYIFFFAVQCSAVHGSEFWQDVPAWQGTPAKSTSGNTCDEQKNRKQ